MQCCHLLSRKGSAQQLPVPLGAFLKFSGCLSQRAVSQERRMLGAPASSPDIIASVASERGSNSVWRQKQISEGIQPPCAGTRVIKGHHLTAQVPRNSTPRFRLLCWDPRGLQPWGPEGALSSQKR